MSLMFYVFLSLQVPVTCFLLGNLLKIKQTSYNFLHMEIPGTLRGRGGVAPRVSDGVLDCT